MFFVALCFFSVKLCLLFKLGKIKIMDQEGPNLKQCGQSTIPIFPSHPEFERYNIIDQSFEPNK